MKVLIGSINTGPMVNDHVTHGEFKEQPVHVDANGVKLYQVLITDHPNASKGVPKIVGHCGESGNMAPIGQHMLEPHEITVVCNAVKEWQKSKQAEKVNVG